MAEPTRGVDNEEDGKRVYDRSGTEPSDSTHKLRQQETQVEDETEELVNGEPDGKEDDDDEITPEDLADAEASPLETAAILYADRVGRGYVNKPRKLGFIRRQLGKRNRIFLIGGPVVGALVIALVIFFSLLPFKILHIVDNLQSHFFSTSENAVQKETNTLFSDYIRRYVMPAARGCRVNIDKNCNPLTGGNLVSQLYKGWKNAKLEDTLKTKYGIEFKYNDKSKHYYLKTTTLSGEGIDLGTADSGFETSHLNIDDYLKQSQDPQFKVVSRAQLRAAVNDALEKETGWKKVMYRFKVGRLLEKKYGFKRCIFACDARDNFADWKDNKTRAAKLIIAERVLRPRSEALYLVLGCILTDSPACNPSQRTVAGDGPNGEPDTPVERDLRAALDKLALEETGKYADVLAHSSGILKDGYAKYVTKQIAGRIVSSFGGDTAKVEAAQTVTSDVVPVIGWINSASSIVKTAENVERLRAYAYLTNASAMIAMYAMYRTYADEIKTGHVDGALVGSMTDSFGPGNQDSAGGIASAEQAPLYGYLIDGDINSSGQAITSIFGDRAYAATANPVYKCSNGKSPPAGQLICPEEVLGGANIPIIAYANDFLNTLGPLKTLADYYNNSIGKVLKILISKLAYITNPLIQLTHLADLVNAAFSQILKILTEYLIPNPFSDNQGGGRSFVLAAGGAGALGSDFSQNGLGGRKLTTEQSGYILNQQNQEAWLQYKNQPLLARLFDTSSNYSVTTKLAMAMPDSAKSASDGIKAAIFSNPFSKLANIFAPIFNSHAYATAGMFPDPFGIPQYGYPDNDPALTAANKDPENYWASNCSTDGTTLDWNDPNKVNAKWVAAATVDPDTGLPEDDTTNPCMLIQATVGSAGALYDSNLLTQDDQGNQ